MSEREAHPLPIRQQRILNFVAGASLHYGLDALTHEALGKFAHINYRIKDVGRDFKGTTTAKMRYPAGTGGQ